MLFKCKHSGNIYEFNLEHDIKEMLKHSDYVAVEEDKQEEPEEKPKRKAKGE